MAAELGKLSSAVFFCVFKKTLKRSDLVNEFEFRVTTVI